MDRIIETIAFQIMKLLESAYFWCFGFTVIFFLGLDFWNWNAEANLTWLNFPGWVFYFICLQILLSAGLLVFAMKVWKTKSEKPEQENNR